MKKVVCVIFGGESSEHEVSLMSASSIVENLDKNKYEIIKIAITKDGKWYRYYGAVEDIIKGKWDTKKCSRILMDPSLKSKGILELKNGEITSLNIDIIFPVLHGKFGEDGTLQGLLEILGLPYVGCGLISSAICMDKDYAHRLVEHVGIKVPNSLVINKNYLKDEIFDFVDKFQFPIYIKPANEGSSVGMTKARDIDELFIGIDEAFKYDKKVILEENIEGFEVSCAIIGEGKLLIGDLSEIEIPKEYFLDYEEKYSLKNIRVHIPARIDNCLKEEVINTAKRIYKALGCSGLARVDMFISNKDGSIVFNEVNTMPGFTTTSLFPTMFTSQMKYNEILDKLIEEGLGEIK